METTQEKVDVLNDLIQINNDRIAGFEKVLADIDDANVDLKEIFRSFADQSRQNAEELAALVGRRSNDGVETGTSAASKLHRAWIDTKSLFGGSDRESILSEAERGEDAIKKAYQDALTEGNLPADAYDIVQRQASGINSAHNQVKTLRDAAKV
ncbi:MAG TPA: PA2169 family four-helix-bundle protein [Mucilaginibacter sp.]|nr:PA2169 family four-helix-bundle protein [Bacteroidota bacterium]HVS92311.1 PA2169 family four-helix-bundle protein [Mucilaginibacter sp.]